MFGSRGLYVMTNGTLSEQIKRKTLIPQRKNKKSNCVYTDLVVNLSNCQLNEDEIKVLAKGLKFIPSPRNINKTEVLADIKRISRRMRLKEYFLDINKATDPDASNTNEHDYEKRDIYKTNSKITGLRAFDFYRSSSGNLQQV